MSGGTDVPNRQAATATARAGGRARKTRGFPQDAIVARGNRGQYVVVVSSLKLVIVRRGFDGRGLNFDLDSFTRDLLGMPK